MKKLTALLLAVLALTSFTPHKELTWIAIGDSITYLNGRPEVVKNRITRGYMDDVVAQLSYIHFVNQGHPGWTAKSIADNIEHLGLDKADIYSVFLGTNDWWTGLPIGTFSDYQNNTGDQTVYGSYRTIVNKILSLNPAAVIILMTPLQRTDYVDLNNPSVFIPGDYAAKDGVFLSQYADAIKDIAKAEHFQLADLYYKSGITGKNAVHYRRLRDPETGQYMTFDGLHPSDKGHAIIAKMLVKIMRKY